MMNAMYVNNCARTIVIFVLSVSFRLNPIPVQGVHFIYVYFFLCNLSNPLKRAPNLLRFKVHFPFSVYASK